MPDINELRDVVRGRVLTDPDDMAPFLTDWRRIWTGRALAVVQPDDAEVVAAVVRWCGDHGVAIVPQGGNTGLSGGATPLAVGACIVLSLARMKAIRTVDAVNNTITVEAGCILADVQAAAQDVNRLFPLSLAAEGSCTIGGNLATNAGGTGVLRYGNMRDLCLGLEVVTADGAVWDGLRALRKDNTGYDLRDLFIGSEGTLGVITAAVLKLFPPSVGRCVAVAALECPANALDLLHLAQTHLSGGLTGFELFSDFCLELVLHHREGARRPVEESAPWYVLIEASSATDADLANEAMQSLLEAGFEQGLVIDAALSSSEAQAEALWALREDISEAQGEAGKTIKHDVALPLSQLADFIIESEAALDARFPEVRTGVFGHVGDGNLHFNVLPRDGTPDTIVESLTGPVNKLVHDIVVARGGSISAEHGLGVLRRDESARYKSEVEMAMMRCIKHALDPRGIMNPDKLLAHDVGSLVGQGGK
ncbi:FAD-binding oxidoreductase [Novosphingobium pentaromativorans]|uniref:FAD linked oxidase domain protein n=2 Tax=Novosphingobium pentaromativorans TaxID=205844 RepID=G6EFM9_9SPHN|nr:FAD-binding oxidoreductase [Novosphingobium pentaromativorans]EHJ59900.1 FAD linked oxidase domain protein [Novosphingobium pentaromativorans US6-1]